VNSETHKGRENCGYFYMNGQIQYYKRSRSSVCGTSALREIWGETFGTVSITLNWQNHEKTSQNTHKSPNCFKPISQAESKDVSTRPFRARHQPAMQPTSLLPPCFFPASFLLPASGVPPCFGFAKTQQKTRKTTKKQQKNNKNNLKCGPGRNIRIFPGTASHYRVSLSLPWGWGRPQGSSRERDLAQLVGHR